MKDKNAELHAHIFAFFQGPQIGAEEFFGEKGYFDTFSCLRSASILFQFIYFLSMFWARAGGRMGIKWARSSAF